MAAEAATRDELWTIPNQPDAPRLVTELPGPKSKAWVARDEVVTSPSYTRLYPLVRDHAVGCTITDPDGNVFLDMSSGIAVLQAGHCHPYVIEAIERQARRYTHMCGCDWYLDVMAELSERLAKKAPWNGPSRVYFGNSGAEAVEGALKLARYHTGKKHVIAFYGAFHGRTSGALSLTCSKYVQRKHFMFVPEVSHVVYPDPYRGAEDGDDALVERTLSDINRIFRHKVDPSEVAAIFVEPIQGEGGYIVPPARFLPALRELCDKHGILLVADEIQTGMGRTGKTWCVENWDVAPDIVTSAKGIASGLPLGAVIAREEVMSWKPGSHGSTFGGNPIACAASLAVMDLLDAGMMEHGARMGQRLLAGLRDVADRFEFIGDARGLGLMTAIDVVKDPETKTPDGKTRDAISVECYKRGMVTLPAGESCLRFVPALNVTEQQVDKAVAILGDAVAAVAG